MCIRDSLSAAISINVKVSPTNPPCVPLFNVIVSDADTVGNDVTAVLSSSRYIICPEKVLFASAACILYVVEPFIATLTIKWYICPDPVASGIVKTTSASPSTSPSSKVLSAWSAVVIVPVAVNVCIARENAPAVIVPETLIPVSYTHLTLPTKRIV